MVLRESMRWRPPARPVHLYIYRGKWARTLVASYVEMWKRPARRVGWWFGASGGERRTPPDTWEPADRSPFANLTARPPPAPPPLIRPKLQVQSDRPRLPWRGCLDLLKLSLVIRRLLIYGISGLFSLLLSSFVREFQSGVRAVLKKIEASIISEF